MLEFKYNIGYNMTLKKQLCNTTYVRGVDWLLFINDPGFTMFTDNFHFYIPLFFEFVVL
jgi:hypothetical protein